VSTNTPQGNDDEMAGPEELEENKRIVREFIEMAFNQHEADQAAPSGSRCRRWCVGRIDGAAARNLSMTTSSTSRPERHHDEQDGSGAVPWARPLGL
jgi:hypothetical protein